ncbi:hypothetical protein [Mycolicibacterium sp. lyk4-40-TYG-92]|uniref:hypothetical protein n=1 Tax=Mycolicibacterium sp. lyk4-40-TYG-92 TaxID=3040295 RepID=UPI00254B9CEB|nr:hypothetical protein [Mycolicibacterium sp. lyk4-40-TYG-92]
MTSADTLDSSKDLTDDELDIAAVRVDESADKAETAAESDAGHAERRWSRLIAFGLLPAVILLLTTAAGSLSYRDHSAVEADTARAQTLRAASDGTVALLSYEADTAEKTLHAARDGLTGAFRDSYSRLVDDVVIPGAKQKHISSVATVPASASVSVTDRHAVALLFVNQTTTVGAGAPTSSTSCVRVTLDKIGDRWLISQFEPV